MLNSGIKLSKSNNYIVYNNHLRLNDQFFFRLGDMANMNFEIWKSLDLPINLFFILQEKFNSAKTEGGHIISVPTSVISPVTQIYVTESVKEISQPTEKIIPQEDKIDLSYKEKSTSVAGQKESLRHEAKKEDHLENLLESIVKEINLDKDSSKIDLLKKLHTVMTNIVSNPNEEKFKKLKLTSKFYIDYLEPYKTVLNLLHFINFAKSEDGQFLEYKGNSEQITQILSKFNQFLITKKLVQGPQNDPYRSSIISTGTNPNELKKVMPKEDLGDLLKKEKLRREEIVRNSTYAERKPKIFSIKDDNINSLIQSLNQADELDVPKVEDQEFFKKAMASINENTERFVMKTRTELENLIKKPVYTKATIRVKFPNEILFQSNFAMMDTLDDVYKTIKEILSDPNEPFYLLIPFPRKMLTDMKATIYSLNLAPSTLVYISFPNIDPLKTPDYPYIKWEILEKYKTEYKY